MPTVLGAVDGAVDGALDGAVDGALDGDCTFVVLVTLVELCD